MGTLADEIAHTLKHHGVTRAFGIPGGGSSLDIMDAAKRVEIPFTLARTEAAASIMAAVTGELTRAPGAVLVGVGPGASSAVNGIAYASLERSPMVLFIDGPASSLHQHFDQQAVYAPLARRTAQLRPGVGAATLSSLLTQSIHAPEGPVVVELTAGDAASDARAFEPTPHFPDAAPEPADIDGAAAMLAASRKPAIIVGLEARAHCDAVRAFADALGAVCFTTYKASGVIDAKAPHFIGPFTGASGENKALGDADLIIGIGFDAIECIPGTWPDGHAPVLMLSEAAPTNPRVPVDFAVTGDLSSTLAALTPKQSNAWRSDDIATLRGHMNDIYAPRGNGFSNAHVVQAMADVVDPATRLCVDAGAHMFAVFGLWPSAKPFGILKSNGLSSMAYALPAAIASKLAEPDVPVIAYTGDGGLAMSLGELATATELDLDITLCVINDAALSLIDIKQQRQQRPSVGVRSPLIDYAAVAQTLGWASEVIEDADALKLALRKPGRKLLDIRIDPAGYGDELARLRG